MKKMSFLLCFSIFIMDVNAQLNKSQVVFVDSTGSLSGDSCLLYDNSDPNNPLLINGCLDANYVPQNGTFLGKNFTGRKFTVISSNWDSQSSFKEPENGVGISYTLPENPPNNGDLLVSDGTAVLSWQKQAYLCNATETYLADTTLNWLIGASKYFNWHSTISRANITSYDTILGINIPHFFIGYGSVSNVYFGTTSFSKYDSSCGCMLGGADIGFKNQITQESAHIKMGNNDFDLSPDGLYLMHEFYDKFGRRFQYNMNTRGLQMRFDKGSDTSEIVYYYNLSDTCSDCVVSMNEARDTLSLSPTFATPLDSVSIYSSAPKSGSMYYCYNCSGGAGAILVYVNPIWRRLKFE